MDRDRILFRIEELLKERHLTWNALKDNAELSSTVYQWKKNRKREATRTPSLKSIEKVCQFFDISLSYFFAFNTNEQKSANQIEVIELINQMDENQLQIMKTVGVGILDKH